MLKEGWLESKPGISAQNRPVRIFNLTKAGAKHLQQQMSSFEKMFNGITRVLAIAES
jgi:DNA-binding PadR family transcriptional regulator